jgi:hypothetical protein
MRSSRGISGRGDIHLSVTLISDTWRRMLCRDEAAEPVLEGVRHGDPPRGTLDAVSSSGEGHANGRTNRQ